MQSGLLKVVSKMGERVLERSRVYYYPQAANNEDSLADAEAISDTEFFSLLREIDSFSAQFSSAHAKPTVQTSGQ